MSADLELRIAAKRFGTQLVLADIHLVLAPGQILALVGASGSGKSTLLRIAAGLDRDYVGETRICGEPIAGVSPQLGFVFQEPRLLPWLSLERNVAFDRGAYRGRDARAVELIARVGLAGHEDALPKALSGGMAQRAAIARALYRRPRVLLLDEPFSAVDAFTRLHLQDLLAGVARDLGTTMLLVTHDVDEAVVLGDRVAVLSQHPGTVVEEIAVATARPRDRRGRPLEDARRRVLDALELVHAI
jgi:sulfonate transport system ATP-binding protein